MSVVVCILHSVKPDHITIALHQNLVFCETLPKPSVTLQMALPVKVGHDRTMSPTQDGTIEIMNVWSLGLNTVWGLQDTGRGALPWSLNLGFQSALRNCKTLLVILSCHKVAHHGTESSQSESYPASFLFYDFRCCMLRWRWHHCEPRGPKSSVLLLSTFRHCVKHRSFPYETHSNTLFGYPCFFIVADVGALPKMICVLLFGCQKER